MEITIKISAKEIAELVRKVQTQPNANVEIDTDQLSNSLSSGISRIFENNE